MSQQLILRNYREGDEKFQAEIYNEVMPDMNPKIRLLAPKEIKTRYKEDSEFIPEQVKILLNSKEEIVGYMKCRCRLGHYSLSHPLILKEYRSESTLNQLFKAIYDYIITNKPKTIRATYAHELKQAHEFIRNQKIAKIAEIRETQRISIPVANLEFKIPGYDLKPFTHDNIEKLVTFRYSKEEIRGSELSVERLTKAVENGEYSPENSSLVYQKDQLLGWWAVKINTPSTDYDPTLERPIGTLNGYVIDMSHGDMIGLRKALLTTGYRFLKKSSISEFRIWLITSSPFYDQCRDLGFEFTGEGEFVYEFEK
ncbi:MAG: hypothetical protein ACXAB4_11320 [Candidatus Hodarchaeales archaeon]|jgi:hypothetical protein